MPYLKEVDSDGEEREVYAAAGEEVAGTPSEAGHKREAHEQHVRRVRALDARAASRKEPLRVQRREGRAWMRSRTYAVWVLVVERGQQLTGAQEDQRNMGGLDT